MKRFYVFILLALLLAPGLSAQQFDKPNLREPTYVSPLYFGPNAFPVPDMLDGRVSPDLRIELAGDYYLGHYGDQTEDIFARLHIPLFTKRANLTIWMPVMEWYQNTDERLLMSNLDTTARLGHEAGDVYISTDIQVLNEHRYAPGITIRAAVKTASGGSYPKARYYDCPGYFFDASFGKSFYFAPKTRTGSSYVHFDDRGNANVELRIAATAGFLCWQTDNGRQNDAVTYGVQAMLKVPYFSLTETFSGYVGWENQGDQPMTIKTRLAGHIKGFEPFFVYQYGIKDYPFHQFRLGLAYSIDIIKR